jgi:hypothetical protein
MSRLLISLQIIVVMHTFVANRRNKQAFVLSLHSSHDWDD